jgi:DDE family transposase
MVSEISLLVMLVDLVDRIPSPPPPPPRRGRQPLYSEGLFMKALVIMLVRGVWTVDGLLAILAQPTPEMRALRARLTEHGRFPARRTWERRLNVLPATLPARIGCFGGYLVGLIAPWAHSGRAVAVDSTVLRARGGVWHKVHREAGIVPHSSIDTEAGWTKSGWHGWVYGWKLHLVTTVAAVWIPLAAELTPANAADNEQARRLLDRLPPEARFVLGDTNYDDPALHERCTAGGHCLVTTRRGRYPHTDDGVEVRRVFHKLRSAAIENFNGQFKGIFDCLGPVPTRGLLRTQRFALGAVFVYQLTLLHRFQHGGDLRVGLKAFLKAA